MKVLVMKVYGDAEAASGVGMPLSKQALASFGEERYRDGRDAHYKLYARRDIGDGCSLAEFAGGIVIAERLADCDNGTSPGALAEALATRIDAAAHEARDGRLRPLWATKWLLIGDGERQARAEEIRAWLADSIRPEDAEAIIDGSLDVSMTWLQYVLVDGAAADDQLEAMRLAQFYYAAKDQINLELLELIGQLSSTGRKIDIDGVTARRSQLEMQGMMHDIRRKEDLRAISRSCKQAVEAVLETWEFADLAATSKDLLKVCADLINAKTERRARSSSFVTEIILFAIGAVAIIDIGVSLAFSSRDLVTNPVLLVGETELPMSARWFLSMSIDTVVLGTLGFVALLVGLYGLFKRWH